MSGRALAVIASGVTWDGVRGSERALAESLTRYVDILWVDPPVSPATPDRHRRIGPASGFRGDPSGSAHRGTGPAGRLWRPELRALSPAVVRLTPVGPPGWTKPGIRALTWPLVRAQIHWALQRAGRRPDVFVACHAHDVLGRWGENVVDVLYGTDDWVAGAALMNQDPLWVSAEERAALARADLVLAVGPELADRWRALGADPVVFPNGCDPQAYQRVPDIQPGPVPGGFPTPVAGVVGRLTNRIDVGLLEAVADTGIGLLLVGPREPSWSPVRVDALLARPNVHHVGAVPFEDLPRWLARMDVGLTPYADSAFNRASFPIKTLEYLAAGRAVVSTDLPASARLRMQTTHVWIAADHRGFADAVRQAAARPRTWEAIQQRRAVAQRHSWAARAAEFARLTGLDGPIPPHASIPAQRRR